MVKDARLAFFAASSLYLEERDKLQPAATKDGLRFNSSRTCSKAGRTTLEIRGEATIHDHQTIQLQL